MFFILLMVELHIILAIFLVSILSFFDFIVFNEEILLALCFLSFLFYCFNTLSESVFSSFESRALKFEQDLLLSFNVSKLSLITEFNSYLKLRSFIVQFIILMASLLKFLDQSGAKKCKSCSFTASSQTCRVFADRFASAILLR